MRGDDVAQGFEIEPVEMVAQDAVALARDRDGIEGGRVAPRLC